jgi:TM2 domain-containing membrane protein YozV
MEEDEKSLVVAYLLACFPPTLIFGLHRHYLKQHKKGILYFLSWFTGIGGLLWFLIDLVNMKSLVRERNYEIALLNDNMDNYLDWKKLKAERKYIEQNKAFKNLNKESGIENKILFLAKKYNGALTASQVAMESTLTIDEADSVLNRLVKAGYVKTNLNDNGDIIYEFIDLM